MEAKTQLTTQERQFQVDVMEKYRKDGIVPDVPTIARETQLSYTTIHKFMNGNSWHKKIRAYLAPRFPKNLNPLPEDVIQLLDIWKGLEE